MLAESDSSSLRSWNLDASIVEDDSWHIWMRMPLEFKLREALVKGHLLDFKRQWRILILSLDARKRSAARQ